MMQVLAPKEVEPDPILACGLPRAAPSGGARLKERPGGSSTWAR